MRLVRQAQHKEFCVMVTIDVRNVFNVARWSGILANIERQIFDRNDKKLSNKSDIDCGGKK